MARFCFRKSQRIVKEEDFNRVLSNKCFVCKGMLRLYKAPNGLDFPRFGVSAGRSVGDAVFRNRCKRLGREVFRLHQYEFASGFDYILIFTEKKPKIKTKDSGSAKPDIKPAYRDIETNLVKMAQTLQVRNG